MNLLSFHQRYPIEALFDLDCITKPFRKWLDCVMGNSFSVLNQLLETFFH